MEQQIIENELNATVKLILNDPIMLQKYLKEKKSKKMLRIIKKTQKINIKKHRNMFSIFPIKEIHDDFLILSNQNFMKIYEVNGIPIPSMDEESQINAYSTLHNALASYPYALKFIQMKMKKKSLKSTKIYSDLSEKQNNPVVKQICDTIVSQLEIESEQEAQNNFFIFIYAESESELRKRIFDFESSFYSMLKKSLDKEEVQMLISSLFNRES